MLSPNWRKFASTACAASIVDSDADFMDFIHKFIPGRLTTTVLLLHGSGGDENDLLPIAGALAPGAAVLSPRGNVVQHGMTRFFALPGQDGFDASDVTLRAADMAGWLGRMIAEHQIDP